MNNKRNVDYPRVGFKPHPWVIVITICIALAYTGLSAQSKGFNDTVILKNGTVLSGVKAVVTKDSLVVTTSEGETSVFTKKEVSEVKKGGGGNGDKAEKVETKTSIENITFSDYQGLENFEDAKTKCAKLGMRLPNIEELKAAYKAKVTESWKRNGYLYWSSTPNGEDFSYSLTVQNGTANYNFRSEYYGVRCIR